PLLADPPRHDRERGPHRRGPPGAQGPGRNLPPGPPRDPGRLPRLYPSLQTDVSDKWGQTHKCVAGLTPFIAPSPPVFCISPPAAGTARPAPPDWPHYNLPPDHGAPRNPRNQPPDGPPVPR